VIAWLIRSDKIISLFACCELDCEYVSSTTHNPLLQFMEFLNAYNLGKTHGKPQWLTKPDGVIEKSDPYIILHDKDGNERVHSLAHLMPYPSRQKGVWLMGDADSFCEFVLKNRTEDQAAVWCNENLFPIDSSLKGQAFICCLFNDFKDMVPGWCDCYCYMLTANKTATESAMVQITKQLKNIPIYKGMPNVELPKSLETQIIDGGK